MIEFNCRFGDPENTANYDAPKGSMVDLITMRLDGNLPEQTEWDERPALGVVLANKGYPESASNGDVIRGLPTASHSMGKRIWMWIFHAGTEAFDNGEIVTNGGRVVCVTALGDDILDAQTTALAVCGAISFDGMQYRRDIGWRAVQS
ncbi:MAG: phosphoribosylglycinamide synthetase C domain-containing protein [Moraxella sp.]